LNKLLRLAVSGIILSATGLALATDFSESEPNNTFPVNFLPGNPVLTSNDRFVGSMSETDVDLQYLQYAGAGVPGLYRYTFDLNASGGDSLFTLFDTHPSGFLLGSNDDFPGLGLSSRVIFDQFDNGGIQTFGTEIEGFDTFNYALTMTRQATPFTTLGHLGVGTTSRSFTPDQGAGSWFQFTLDQASTVNIDTLGSPAGTDSELALFDASGQTLNGNDDISINDFRSSMTNTLSAGTYYVSTGYFQSFKNWDDATGTQLGWDRNGFSGGTTDTPGVFGLNINITPAPEPATIATIGLGFALLLRRRRK
jgi:hypothetical protein